MTWANWKRILVYGPGLAIVGVFAGNSAIATAQEIAVHPQFDWLAVVRLFAEILVSAGGTTAGGWTLLSTVLKKREAFARGDLVERVARLEASQGQGVERPDPVLNALAEMRGLLVSGGPRGSSREIEELKGRLADMDNKLVLSDDLSRERDKAIEAHMAEQDESLKDLAARQAELATAQGETAEAVRATAIGVDGLHAGLAEVLKRLPPAVAEPVIEPTSEPT